MADKFWPGPLSLILPANDNLSSLITGGTDKVGFRMPANKVAYELIERSGPLAATSANLSNRPSPTTAQHVLDDLDGKIRAILDAGTTTVGIESTIVDVSETTPKILRLGGILAEEIAETIGANITELGETKKNYISKVKIILSENEEDFQQNLSNNLLKGQKLAIVHNNYSNGHIVKGAYKEYGLDISSPSSQFFTILRDAEHFNIDILLFTPFPADLAGVNKALLDRIYKTQEARS